MLYIVWVILHSVFIKIIRHTFIMWIDNNIYQKNNNKKKRKGTRKE